MLAPHVFDPADLIAVVQSNLGRSPEDSVTAISQDLERRYPGRINTRPRWVFSKAGGLMGTMILLHASLHEYILLFGCPAGSGGFSGRHRTDLWDIVITGELWTHGDDELEAQRHKPGDCSRLQRGQTNYSRLDPGTFLLEYARGPIPTMLPFGLLEVATSTLDARAFGVTLAEYTKCVTGSLIRDVRALLGRGSRGR